MAVFNIAAGHGAGDPGAVSGSRKEKDDNLRLALAVGDELLKRGHTVRQFRTDDSNNCSAAACKSWLEANSAHCSIVFHRNAFSQASANGVEVWSFNADAKACDVAVKMSAAIAQATGFSNRGRKGNGAAWISSKACCVEPEVGFITNSADNARYDNSFGGVVTAVCDTLEVSFGKVEKPEPKPEPLPSGFESYLVKVTVSELNMRKGPGTNHPVTGVIKDKGTYTIVDEAAGQGAAKWGKLKSGAGWIALDYVKRL